MANTIIYHVIYSDGFRPVRAIHKVAEFKWKQDAIVACEALNEASKSKEWKDKALEHIKDYYSYTEKSGAWNNQQEALKELNNILIEKRKA